MDTKKLSGAQKAVVSRLREGWGMGFSKAQDRYWLQRNGIGRGGETEKIPKNTALVLIKQGIVERYQDGFPVAKYRLSAVCCASKTTESTGENNA